MKIKVGTQFEAEVYQQLKLAAARERRPVSDLLEEAVGAYLCSRSKSGLSRMLGRAPLEISGQQFRKSLDSDYWDQ